MIIEIVGDCFHGRNREKEYGTWKEDKIFEGDEFAQGRERESAGEEGAGCIQEVKEDKNSQQRRCYSDVSVICLTSHSAQCI